MPSNVFTEVLIFLFVSVRLSKAAGNMHSVGTVLASHQLPVGVAAPQAILSQPPVSLMDIHLVSHLIYGSQIYTLKKYF